MYTVKSLGAVRLIGAYYINETRHVLVLSLQFCDLFLQIYLDRDESVHFSNGVVEFRVQIGVLGRDVFEPVE